MQPKGIVGTVIVLGGLVPAWVLALSSFLIGLGASVFWDDREAWSLARLGAVVAGISAFVFPICAAIVGIVWRALLRAKILKRGERPREDAAATATCAVVTAFALLTALQILLFIYVTPPIAAMYAELGSVPDFTQAVMTLSQHAEKWWPLVIAGALLATALFGFAFRRLYLRRVPAYAWSVYGIALAANCAALQWSLFVLFGPLIP